MSPINTTKLDTHAQTIGVELTHPDEIVDLLHKIDHARTWTLPERGDLASALLNAKPGDWTKTAKQWAASGDMPDSKALHRAIGHQARLRITTAAQQHADQYLAQVAEPMRRHIARLTEAAQVIEQLDDYEGAVRAGNGDQLLAAQQAAAAINAYRELVIELLGERSIAVVVTPPADLHARRYAAGTIDNRFPNLEPEHDYRVWSYANKIKQSRELDWLELARQHLGFTLTISDSANDIRERATDFTTRCGEEAITDLTIAQRLIVSAKPTI